MRSKTLQRIIDNTPKHVEVYVEWYSDLVILINNLIRQKQLTIDNVNKDSQVYAWFTNEFEFDLHSIAKLSVELGMPLLQVQKTTSQGRQDG